MCEPRCLKEPRSEIVECFILNVLVLGLVSLLCSCAAPIAIVIPVIVDTFTLEAPFDEVWQATVATIAEKSLPIEA